MKRVVNLICTESPDEVPTVHWRLVLDADGDPELQCQYRSDTWNPVLCISPKCGLVLFDLEGALQETPYNDYIDEESGAFKSEDD